MKRFIARLFGRKPRTIRKPARQPARARLGLDAFEDRYVPATVSWSGSVLEIVGTNAAEAVTVQRPDSDTLLVNVTTGSQNEGWWLGGFGFVTELRFTGYDGDDQFTNVTDLYARAYGGTGNDTLTGGQAGDNLQGQDGNDRLAGGGGQTNRLDGGGGNDVFVIDDKAAGFDMVYEGGGFDTIDFSASKLGVTFDLGLSFATQQVNALRQVRATDGFEKVVGSAGNDYLYGSAANDIIDGFDGHDVLAGRGGNDTLDGNLGYDVVRETGDRVYNAYLGLTYVLTDGKLSGSLGEDTFSGIDRVDLTGSIGPDYFDVGGWTGWALIDGGDGSDTVAATRDANYCLMPSGILFLSSGRSDTTSIERFRLTGGTGDNTFYLSNYPGEVVIDPGTAGRDTLDFTNSSGVIVDLGKPYTNQQPGAASSLYFFPGIERIVGSPYADLLRGTAGADTLNGAGGDDQLYGEGGDDFIDGGYGHNYVQCGDGNDVVEAGSERDTVYGGEGNDAVYAGGGDDQVFGGNGNDTIDGGGGFDQLYGEGHDDTLSVTASTGTSVTFGGTGNDTIWGGNGRDFMYGGEGNDCFAGGGGNDVISGGNGNDGMSGNAGNDELYGEGGDDYLYGNDGNDTLQGGAGNDVVGAVVWQGAVTKSGYDTYYNWQVSDEPGDDVMDGEADNDTVRGGTGNDLVYGGDGSDTLGAAVKLYKTNGISSAYDTTFVVLGEDGRDTLRGGYGNDTLCGGYGDDELYGESGNDRIGAVRVPSIINNLTDTEVFNATSNANTWAIGEDGNDVLEGGDGDDYLDGGRGSDRVYGNNGADHLRAGTGNGTLSDGATDWLWGGADGDRFDDVKTGEDNLQDHNAEPIGYNY